MRLRKDTRGEIGVFEDMQTLVVVLVGVGVLLGSTLYNWSSITGVERDQEMYDEAEHIVEQIESWDRIRAVNHYGSVYDDFMLRQPELVTLVNEGGFEDEVRSDLNYHVTFDDLVVGPGHGTTSPKVLDTYEFGKPVPEGMNTVVISIQYSLVFTEGGAGQDFDVSERHPCLVTVVVWR